MRRSSLTDSVKPILSGLRRLHSIKYTDPALTPANWCKVQPCTKIRVGSREIILTQPSSSFLVYLLGVLTIGAGVYFLLIRGNELSRLWWGISLLLWGIGALLAGTSYQAFAYEIKCRGRQSCSWTSWWEVVYLIFQQVSMDAMLVAVAYSCTSGAAQIWLLVYAMVNSLVYTIFVFVGATVPYKSFITFKVMVAVSTPIVLILLSLNGWRYYTYSEPLDLVLFGTWILLLLTSALYCLYDDLEITWRLWQEGEGSWFSQNDVLHVCLIFWVIYIVTVVAHHVTDYVVPV